MKKGIKKIVAALTATVIMMSSFQTTVIAKSVQMEATSSTEIAELTARLIEADGTIPADFSQSDMDKFLKGANPEVVAEIFDRIEKNLKPATAEVSSLNSKTVPFTDCDSYSETYTEYIFDTGEVKTRYMKDDYFDTQKVREKVTLQSSGTKLISPRAWPDYWFEQNPQNYYDTKATCRVITKVKNSSDLYGGSGFLISGDTLVTASHNIYSPNYNGWCDYIVVIPSLSSSYQEGYYSYTTSSTVWIGNYYINQTYYRGDDWGVAKLKENFNITPFSLVSYGSQSHDDMWIRTQGYPVANSSIGADGQTLYLTTGEGYSRSNTSDYLKYGTSKVYTGMSGGPVLVKDSNNQYYVAGIISGGVDASPYEWEINNVVYVAFDTNLYNSIMSKI